jgi:hypothetical protein
MTLTHKNMAAAVRTKVASTFSPAATGGDDHFVGVQCRLITKPVKEPEILADARAALKLEAGLKELVFATTAPDDTKTADVAVKVTRTLKAEGHDLTVVVYGWGQLQVLIAPTKSPTTRFIRRPWRVPRCRRQVLPSETRILPPSWPRRWSSACAGRG